MRVLLTNLSLRRLAAVAGAMLCPVSLFGQEAINHSLAESPSVAIANALANANANTSPGGTRPNFQVGPVGLRATAGVEVEFNDNVNVAEQNRESDLILRPRLSVAMRWKATQENTLSLDLGMGYAFYLQHRDLNTNSILVSPNSALQFNIFVSDFRFNLHDRFSVEQDPVTVPSVSNSSNFGRFENTAGIQADWNLSSMAFTLGYDHYNYISTSSTFNYLNHSSEIVTGRAAFGINPTIVGGLESVLAFTNYSEGVLSNNTSLQVGPFINAVLTPHLRFQVSAGYEVFAFSGPGNSSAISNLDTSTSTSSGSQNGYYARFIAVHDLNAYLTHSLSLGHQTEVGTTSDTLEVTYARYQATLKLLKDIGVSANASYEHGKDGGGFAGETYNFYGCGLNLDYRVTPSITASVGYQFYRKSSDVALQSYFQNRVVLSFQYAF